jgi:hypothetical protein
VLISVSTDGLALPEVYSYPDGPALWYSNATNYTASPITKINGVDVETYLNERAALDNNQDPDANYNGLFYQIPLDSQQAAIGETAGYLGSYAFGSLYFGNSTTTTYKNGTTSTRKVVASAQQALTGVTDGRSFFETFCTGPSSDNSSSSSSSNSTSNTTVPTTEVTFTAVPTETALPSAPWYPHPLVVASDYSIAGYFPKKQPDLAVLAINTFEPASMLEFQDIVRETLATVYAKNKTKLAIDLRGNHGGDIFLAYDLFTQLFPSSQPYGLSNFRATPMFNDIGQIVTSYYSNITDDDIFAENATLTFIENDYGTPFDLKDEVNASLNDFASWSDFFGPHFIHGDNFTSAVRYNLSDLFATGGFSPSGFQGLEGIDPVQVFSPEDIILIQDGACASTCTIFSETMKTQTHVQQVVFGGRKQYGPMQGVGGVKGSNIWDWTALQPMLLEAWTDGNDSDVAYLNQNYGTFNDSTNQALLRAAPAWGSASINARNQIREGDESVTPLQFVYEAAHCRLFYTAKQIRYQEYVWYAAYDAAWGNGTCVQGSTDQTSSQPGTGYMLSPPPSSANNTFDSNVTSSYPTDIGAISSSSSAVAPTSTGGSNSHGTVPSSTTTGAASSATSGAGASSTSAAAQRTNAAIGPTIQSGVVGLVAAGLAGLLSVL